MPVNILSGGTVNDVSLKGRIERPRVNYSEIIRSFHKISDLFESIELRIPRRAQKFLRMTELLNNWLISGVVVIMVGSDNGCIGSDFLLDEEILTKLRLPNK